MVSWPVPNGQAIGDATRRRDNLTTKVGPGRPINIERWFRRQNYKGKKEKEKKLKSDKPDPSEEAQDLNKTKINFQP